MFNLKARIAKFLNQSSSGLGVPHTKGMCGPQGARGPQGESAYDIYKRLNPTSPLTEEQWIDSISVNTQQKTNVKKFFASWVKETWNQLPEEERNGHREAYKLNDCEKPPLNFKGVIDNISELPEDADVGDTYFYRGVSYTYAESGTWANLRETMAIFGETTGSAGIDLRAITIRTQDTDSHFSRANSYELSPGEVISVHTGLSIWIKDPHCAGFILPRSGLGSKQGIVLGNLVGLIDSDYQGELIVTLWNRSDKPFTLKKGERIAQYLVVPRIEFTLEFNDEYLEETQRGSGGFGSTGTK